MSDFTPMKGRGKIKIPVHHVVDILRDIHDQGHSAAFAKAAKTAGASISIDAASVNFIKKYLTDAKLHEKSDVARSVAGACPGGDPYTCPYRQT